MVIEKLKILGHEYTVTDDLNIQVDDGQVAQINMRSLEIRIGAHLPSSREDEALLHEIVEALNYHLELKLEHRTINQLSEGLFQVLKDNGLLKIP